MINKVLSYTKKYYPYTIETQDFKIVSDGIECDLAETYIINQYINIAGSVLNDGTYKVLGVTDSKLTLDATMLVETATDAILWGLRLPITLINLTAEINTYNEALPTKAELSSESQGNRSVSYKDGSSWQSTFKNELSSYKSMFDDRTIWCRKYNINTKGW